MSWKQNKWYTVKFSATFTLLGQLGSMTSDSETKGLTTLCTGLNMQPYTNGSTILILVHTKSQWVSYEQVQLPTNIGGIYTMSNHCLGSCYQTSSVTHVRTEYIFSQTQNYLYQPTTHNTEERASILVCRKLPKTYDLWGPE